MPIITISRMFGAGGSLVAGKVADALGWPLLDNAFVEAVAQGAGITAQEVIEREERVPSLVDRVLRALALGSPETLPALAEIPTPSEERLLAVTRRVIEEAAAAGPAVLVGRGAQAVLADDPDALHVFCHAPLEALVARVAARLAAGADTARAEVERVNRQREQYVRTHFGRDWRAMDNYHLCLDTEALGIDGAADLVVMVARRRFGG
ncbi:MAG TPA: cytidylate kinase-like family protein [Gemmatimonadales bacterium]